MPFVKRVATLAELWPDLERRRTCALLMELEGPISSFTGWHILTERQVAILSAEGITVDARDLKREADEIESLLGELYPIDNPKVYNFYPFWEHLLATYHAVSDQRVIRRVGDEMIRAMIELTPPFPDVRPALEGFRAAGVRIIFFNKREEAYLAAYLRRYGLEGLVDLTVSETDACRAFIDPGSLGAILDRIGSGPEKAAGVANDPKLLRAVAAVMDAYWIVRGKRAAPPPGLTPLSWSGKN